MLGDLFVNHWYKPPSTPYSGWRGNYHKVGLSKTFVCLYWQINEKITKTGRGAGYDKKSKGDIEEIFWL